MRCTSRTVNPQPGMTPTRACVSAKRARSEAMRKSQFSATSKPPVTATPFTAPIKGFRWGGSAPRNGSRPCSSRSPTSAKPSPCCTCPEPNSFRSTPALNAGSAPVRIITSTSSRSSHAVIARGSALRTARFSALRWSGRLIVIVATRSAISVRTTSSCHRKSNATLMAPVWSWVASVVNASRQSSRRNVCVSMPVRSTRPSATKSR